MPYRQKVNTEARLTRMIEDMGITLHPMKEDEKKRKPKNKRNDAPKEKN
jgi:hypothetical protein